MALRAAVVDPEDEVIGIEMRGKEKGVTDEEDATRGEEEIREETEETEKGQKNENRTVETAQTQKPRVIQKAGAVETDLEDQKVEER